MTTTLTAAETAELTPLNAAAHYLLRVTGVITPCWLCLSEEARTAARAALLIHLDDAMPALLPHDESTAAALLEQAVLRSPVVRSLLAVWRTAEAQQKIARQAGDPAAFFAR